MKAVLIVAAIPVVLGVLAIAGLMVGMSRVQVGHDK